MRKSPTEAELRERLTEEQYRVVREGATEPPFANAYWDNRAAGVYLDVVSGDLLFASEDKFDSGCGWPSFSKPAIPGALVELPDRSHGMERVEVRAAGSGSHLGHVFPDGPGPGGLRYCINSAALRFVPREECVAIFAAGCFWGVEAYFKRVAGVLEAVAGYTGGSRADPDYASVCTGLTGHAEAVSILFDPERVSYLELARRFFLIHDPTTEDRQGADRGSQYRSAVFVVSERQRELAEKAMGEAARRHDDPIVTEILDAGAFYPAEEYHQRYLDKHPGGYCHVDLRRAEDPLGES